MSDFEITCKQQRDVKVSAAWCDNVQYQQLCIGCVHNLGRKRSKYQQAKDRQEAAGSRSNK